MPNFYLSNQDIHKLKRRFNLFKRERNIIHDMLNNYIADYRQFNGSMTKRYEYLRKKYISQSPDLTHLISLDNNILWSVQDISIVLGRHLTSIIRSINKLEHSNGWCARLLSIREITKNPNGRTVNVYRKEIFDLLLDLYEDEYLLRFSQPRRGNNNSAPNIHELRRFWLYLKDFDNFNSHIIEHHLPDIPAMNLKDILSLIWNKVFSLKITTVASVVFALCFELSRRFLGIHLWIAIIPALIAGVCIILIHSRKLRPDTSSDIAAGSIFFLLLWISAAIPFHDDITQNTKQNIILSAVKDDRNNIQFNIVHNIKNVKQFLYCISPDILFRSTGFLYQFNPDTNSPYPALTIPTHRADGLVDIDLKFIDEHDYESDIWHFSLDLAQERFKLNKDFILSFNNYSWVSVYRTHHDAITEVALSPFLFSKEIQSAILHVLYGINNERPDIQVDFDRLNTVEPYVLLKTDENDIQFVSSQIIFMDGSSSDVRVSSL